MTDRLRFIHTADFHLGAPMRGICETSPEWAARLERSIPEAYDRVIEAALTHAVDFVVIAGDVFDTSRPSYGDYRRFFEGVERLSEAGIPVYLVAGNHDPFTSWGRGVDRLPDLAHLLGVNGPEFSLFERDGEPVCLIGGRGYFNQSWPIGESIAQGITRADAEAALGERAAQAPFSIGITHTGLDLDMSKASVDEAELFASGLDYWACGHIHSPLIRPSKADPRVVFSGCVQGRDIRETGERGCFLVELERRPEAQPGKRSHAADMQPSSVATSLEFIPTSSVVLEQLKVDVSACQTLADVVRHVQAELFRANGRIHCDEMFVRITLTGETSLHEFLIRPDVIEDLRGHVNNSYPSFYCDLLLDDTLPPDEDAGAPGMLPSILAEIADGERGREDVLINYVQAELVKRGIAVPSSLTWRIGTFNDSAERLVRDLLNEGRE